MLKRWEGQRVEISAQRRGDSWIRRHHPCNGSRLWRRTRRQNFLHHPTGIPLWEREFICKIGLFTWKRFTEAKQYVHLDRNILQWNDSAGEDAFYEAKNRFKAIFHGLPCNIPLPNPDMYIDEVEWDSEIDPKQLSDDLEVQIDDEEDQGNENGIPPSEEVVHNNISLADIVPTGWDVDLMECSGPKVLTGLIIG